MPPPTPDSATQPCRRVVPPGPLLPTLGSGALIAFAGTEASTPACAAPAQ